MTSSPCTCTIGWWVTERKNAPLSLESVNPVVNAMANRERRMKTCDALKNLSKLIDVIGLTPELSRMRVIHVAGTKGKGTTSWYISKFLKTKKVKVEYGRVIENDVEEEEHGERVGTFTSPHLIDVRERFLIDNQKLSEESFSRYFFDVVSLIYNNTHGEEHFSLHMLSEGLGLFSFFFILFLYICQQEKVDIAVVEVGIGGRMDTTSLITSEVSVITALGFDHMNVLGKEVTLIAHHKAGIIKPGNTACFSFSQKDYPETRKILETEARECGVPIFFHDSSRFPLASSWPARLGMGGEHLRENSMVGLQVARYVRHSSRSRQQPPPSQICSSSSSTEELVNGEGEGIPDYLSFPLTEEELYVLCFESYPGRSQFLVWNMGAPSSLSSSFHKVSLNDGFRPGIRSTAPAVTSANGGRSVNNSANNNKKEEEEHDGSRKVGAGDADCHGESITGKYSHDLSRIFFYLDGAHTPESMVAGTKWFIHESLFREQEEQRRQGSTGKEERNKEEDAAGTGAGSPSPFPPAESAESMRTTTTTTSGRSMKKEEIPREEASISPYRILCFWTSRDPALLLQAISPFASQFQKVVVIQIFSPKRISGSPLPGDVMQWKIFATELMNKSKSTWEALYPSCCPCEGMPKPLERIEELLPYLLPTPASVEPHFSSLLSGSVVPHVFVTGSLFLIAKFLEVVNIYDAEHS